MRVLGQILSGLAVALGVGLLVAGSERDVQFFHGLAAGLKGFGAGFLTLGILGLLLPWANALVSARRVRTVEPVTPSNPSPPKTC